MAVLVHSDDKAGRDSGELVGSSPNGVITTQSVDEVIATGPDAAIYSGMLWDVPLITRLLREGINVYTGMGGYFLPGQPEFDEVDAAGKAGNASFAAGGNIPGLISDVFPLFVTGYTGRIDYIRAWQRNHVSTYPSAAQIQSIGLGVAAADEEYQAMVDGLFRSCLGQSANMIATALGIECTRSELTGKELVAAAQDVTLEGSGLLVKKGAVAGARWEVTGYTGDRPFVTITNEQTAVLGLGRRLAQGPRAAPLHGGDRRGPSHCRDDGLASGRRARSGEFPAEFGSRHEHDHPSRIRPARRGIRSRLPHGRRRRRFSACWSLKGREMTDRQSIGIGTTGGIREHG